MKKIVLLLIIFIPLLGITQSNSNDIVGIWLTQIEDAKVEIYKKSNKYYGRVVWIAEPIDENGNPVVDAENPNTQLKTRPILKMDILTALVYDNDGEWDGEIYDPKKGEIYTCKVWLENNKLMVRGYWGWLFDTKTWTKAKI